MQILLSLIFWMPKVFARVFIMASLIDGILLRVVIIGFCESEEERNLHPLWDCHSLMQKEY